MLIIRVKLCCLWFWPPDSIPAGAGRGSGARGDGTKVSAEWSLGRGALWSLWRANQSSAAGLPMIQPWLWFPTLRNKRLPPAQSGSREGWSESLLPATGRFESGTRQPETSLEVCGFKVAAGDQRDGSNVYCLHHCIPAESSNLINRGQRLCFWKHFERLHSMLLLVFVGFCSYKPTICGPFHRFI